MDDALLQFCDFIIAAKDKTPLFHINQLISKICNSTAVVLTLEVIIHKIVEVSVIALYIKYSTIGFIAATRLPT